MNLLAFDLGASGGKLFLAVIRDGEVSIRDIHRFDNISYSMGNGLYWDILNIYREMNRGIKKAIELTSDQIDAFAIDSFSNDFGLIDRTARCSLRSAVTGMSAPSAMQTRFTVLFPKSGCTP